MKYQIVNCDKGYVAISDEKITEGFFLHPKGVIFPVTEIYIRGPISTGLMKKIIATDTTFKLEGIAQFELPAILDGGESTDLIELAETKYPYIDTSIGDINKVHNIKVDSKRIAFIQGYKAAQEKGCYTEEDMEKAFLAGEKWEDRNQSIDRGEITSFPDALNVHDFIDSLKQPKKLVAIEINDMEASQWISNEKEHGRVNINLPIVTKSEQHPDGLLTIKQYFYE